MRKTYLNLWQTLHLVWWMLTFRACKVKAMLVYEEWGMVDVLAYRRVKKMPRGECKDLVYLHETRPKK